MRGMLKSFGALLIISPPVWGSLPHRLRRLRSRVPSTRSSATSLGSGQDRVTSNRVRLAQVER